MSILKQNNTDWFSLITLTANGVEIPTYNELQQIITDRFKWAYGSDIDLSPGSADSIYINNYCLIMNNILQNVKNLYLNLNVNQATGVYLDNLCALSNIRRREATASAAYVTLTLSYTSNVTFATGQLLLADSSGNVWENIESVTLVPNTAKTILVKCQSLGPVVASAGSINRLVDNSYVITVSQTTSAIVGRYREGDTELRARRGQTLGAYSNTVLEGLASALYQRPEIEDVWIYNNTNSTTQTLADKTVVDVHRVYIVLRYNPLVQTTDNSFNEIVAKSILNKMTPGILTQAVDENNTTNGVGITKSVVQEIQSVDTAFSIDVSWKVATAEDLTINVSLNKRATYVDSTDNAIADKLRNYLSNLQIGTNLTFSDLAYIVESADSYINGKYTFTIADITVNGTSLKTSDHLNGLTYYTASAITVS